MAIFSAQELLTRHGIQYVATQKNKYSTACPTCGNGYLNVEIKSDRVVWYCQSCKEGSGEQFDQPDATGELGEPKAIYDYHDEKGARLFQVLRFEPVNGAKQFRQRTDPDQKKWSLKGVRIVPFLLPDLIDAVTNDKVIYVVEGEKDVLTLRAHNLAATCNAMGAGKWRADFAKYFDGADVVICGDNDKPGRDHVIKVARTIIDVARCVRILDLQTIWPTIEESDDITDWFVRGGGTVDALEEAIGHIAPLTEIPNGYDPDPPWSDGKPGRAEPLPAPSVVWPMPVIESDIPLRDWVVLGLLMRRQVTVFVAPPGAGKSLLTLQLGLACAHGTPWSGWRPRKTFRVMIINSEDDIDEMRRRLVAATLRMSIKQDGVRNRLCLIDNSASGAVIAKFDMRSKTLVRTPLLDQIVKAVLDNEIDIVFVDPFAETFEGDENSNSELKWAGMLWREVARRTNASVCLVHHTKKYATGMAGDVDAARGAGALIGIARIVSTLFPMTAREAEAMGVADDKRGYFLRYDDAKANLNIKSPFARWFEKQTVTLQNGKDDLPGDDVGVLIPWAPKGPSLLELDIINFFAAVDKGVLDQHQQPTGEFYTFDGKRGPASSHSVVDFALAHFDLESRAQAAKLIEGWRRDKRLEQILYRSPRARKARPRVISELDPLAPKRQAAEPRAEPDLQEAFDYGLHK